MTIQEIIAKESEILNHAYDLKKDGMSALKDLKKDLKKALKYNPDWTEKNERLKILNTNRKGIIQQIRETQKEMDQIAA